MVALRESERKNKYKAEREGGGRERERDVIKNRARDEGEKNGRETLGWYFSSTIYRSG
jgi:hypothetical protein